MADVSRKPNGLISKGRNAQEELGIMDLEFEKLFVSQLQAPILRNMETSCSYSLTFPRNLLPSSSVLKGPEKRRQ
jgi:hypothetical protein